METIEKEQIRLCDPWFFRRTAGIHVWLTAENRILFGNKGSGILVFDLLVSKCFL